MSDLSDACGGAVTYDGDLGIRVSSIFVILVGSTFGAVFPVFARRHPSLFIPEWSFFIAKFFGSGVIIATAFIHLLSPAYEALGSECLTGPIKDYDWVAGIVLMVVFVMFFLELMVMRFAKFGEPEDSKPDPASVIIGNAIARRSSKDAEAGRLSVGGRLSISNVPGAQIGEDHLGHAKVHIDNDDVEPAWQTNTIIPEAYAAQLTGLAILEFGVIFHSVFVGLTLAVIESAQLKVLYVVLVFHQTFEGLGLGSRLATTPWPAGKRWTPYVLAIAYGLTTPIAIAAGLGARETFKNEATTTLIVNGVFDSISAGILIYTGLVELMAHEFMFSNDMTKAPLRVVLSAFACMCVGAGLMALLGKWA